LIKRPAPSGQRDFSKSGKDFIMKLTVIASPLVAALLVAGCASSDRLVLAPVGPAPFQESAAGSKGSLVVYSAFDPHAHFNGFPYRHYYTDYKILAHDGRFLRTVENDNGVLLEGPRAVTLPPGTYHVIARANGHGLVTVPVVIAARQVTTVHLEGGSSWPNKSALARSNPVRLPGGEIVGWRGGGDALAGH
jgi:hypothetical protein